MKDKVKIIDLFMTAFMLSNLLESGYHNDELEIAYINTVAYLSEFGFYKNIIHLSPEEFVMFLEQQVDIDFELSQILGIWVDIEKKRIKGLEFVSR